MSTIDAVIAAVTRKRIALVAVVLIAFGVFRALRAYDSDMGVQTELTPTNTAHDFRVASKSARSRWLEKMCDDGVCLDPIDWKCGFSFTSVEASDLKTETGQETLFQANPRVL